MKISNINNLLSKDAEAKAFFMSLPEDAQGVLIGRGSTITSTAEMAAPSVLTARPYSALAKCQNPAFYGSYKKAAGLFPAAFCLH